MVLVTSVLLIVAFFGLGEGCGGGGGGGAPRPPPPPPLPSRCGVSVTPQSRIIGGKDARKGSWPWISALWMFGEVHACGGALLNKRWVLTAAQCVEEAIWDTSSLKVKVGGHDIRYPDGAEQEIAVEKIIIHPKFSRENMTNDIALIKLKNPAKLTKRVLTLCLPSKGSKPQIGSHCFIAGSGSIKTQGNFHFTLQQARLPIVSSKSCFNRTDVICSGYGADKQTSACNGDFGGPLMCLKQDGSFEAQGVASFTVQNCKSYTAFEPVGVHVDWINSHINH